MALDHGNDAHWTKTGAPSLEAVSELYGSNGVTRRMIDAVAPGHRRKS